MPSIILKKYAEPESLLNNATNSIDIANPMSYSEWLKRNYGVDADDSESQYQKYLLDWYSNKEEETEASSLKEDYKNLIKNLSFVFRNDSEFRKISSIDLDDDLQLKLVLPYYVKKLKEIALYYRDKRESVKNAKIKYNMVGSLNAIERTFYQYILKAFSKRDYVLNVPSQTAWNAFPELTSINNGFSIEIEELYDESDYFDSREEDTYSYNLSSSNPLISILDNILNEQYSVSSLDQLSLSALQEPIITDGQDLKLNLQSLQLANDRYLGADKYLLSGGYFDFDTKDINLNFKGGNNFFYWFSGEYFREAPHRNYLPISANEIDWIGAGATAGSEYSASDLMFVDYNGNIEGAWLANINSVSVSADMQVNLKNNKAFKYPYPGFGLSAEGFEWTGKTIKEFQSFNKTFFPNQTIKNKIEKQLQDFYWTTTTDSISSVRPISIHESNLIESGAFASSNFHLADKVITRPDTSDGVHDDERDEVFSNDLNVEWLYDFHRTQLPITNGDNKIYWPLQRYDTDDELTIEYNSGESIFINDIPSEKWFGATASTSIEDADIIFKSDSRCGNAVEAAWLEGISLETFNPCSTAASAVITEFTGIADDIDWTPFSVTSLRNWWIPEGVRSIKGRDVFVNRNGKKTIDKYWQLGNWRDEVSNQNFSRVRKPSNGKTPERPRVRRESTFVSFNNRANRGTEYETDLLEWKATGEKIQTPLTIGLVFNLQKAPKSKYTIFYAKGPQDIEIFVNRKELRIKVGGTTRTIGRVFRGTWYDVILVLDGVNSKVFFKSGSVRKSTRYSNTQINKIQIGANLQRNNRFSGWIRDIVVFNDALKAADIEQFILYMRSLISAGVNRKTISFDEEEFLKQQLDAAPPEATPELPNEKDYTYGAIQPGISMKAEPREYTRFLWTGNGGIFPTDNINGTDFKAFHGQDHDEACPYYRLTPEERKKLTSDVGDNKQWKKCECGAIQYSPLGHKGDTFRSEIAGGIGDFIILDTTYPKFSSLDDWKGSDELPWNNSEDFGWFKLDDDNPDDVGWGTGKWLTNYGEEFKLKPGKLYRYYRSGFNSSCETILEGGREEPFFVLKYANCDCRFLDCACKETSCRPIWKRAVLTDGVWVDSGEESTLQLEAGKYYTYRHRSKQNFGMLIRNEDTGELEDYADCVDSGNFILSVDIEEANPYWASGSYEMGPSTKQKGVMYGGEANKVVFDYLYITQPKPSSLVFTDDLYMRYERNSECSTDCFVWEQPLTWDVKVDSVGWKKLDIDNCVKSDILDFIQNTSCGKCLSQNRKCDSCCEAEKQCGCLLDKCITTKVGVSANDELSPIVLMTEFDSFPVFVNYYAQNEFNIDLEVVDTTLGLPPTGGKWFPEKFVDYSYPVSPWANIPNVYNPMVAINQVGNLYNKKDIGFFTPRNLGFTNLILTDKNIEIESYVGRSSSTNSIVLDKEHYTSGPYVVTYSNATWMKHKSQCIGGELKDAKLYQKFIPYQSSYESIGINEYGIERQSDTISPWTGETKTEFSDSENYPSNIKGEYPVYCGPNSWFNNQPNVSGDLLQWRSDIYGNQYGLYKVSSPYNIYARDNEGGYMWVRRADNSLGNMQDMLPRVIDTYSYNSTLINQLTGGQLIGFELYYDTLSLRTPDYLIFERITFDYTDSEIYSVADDASVYNVSSGDYCGEWLNEREKKIIFSYLSGGVPVIRERSIDKNYTTVLFSGESDITKWDVSLDSYDIPKFTFNDDSNEYNISMLAVSGGSDVLIVSNFEFETDKSLSLKNVKVIDVDPMYNKKLLSTRAYDSKLLLIFEEQTEPNQIYQITIDN